MAKKEKLEALVPPEEQPYPVPDNWRWVYFGSVIELISGRDASLKECNDQGVGIPYILGASNIDSNTFTVERWIEVPQVVSIKGDILLSVKGTIGKVYLQQEEFINLSRQIMAIRSKAVLRSKYCYYFVLSICEALREAGNGLIPGISRSDILETKISVPSFEEQQRIVDRIESLFAKLDEAKEKAQAVVDGFEDRKAAILHKAFTGELTETWRKKNKVEISTWKEKRIDEISTVISGYAFVSNDFSSENTVPCIKITNVGVGEYIDGYEYLPENYLLEYHRFETQKGDVLIALTRSYIAAGLKVCINMCAQRALLNQRVALIRDCNTEYLYYYLKSDSVLQYVKEKSKITNQPNLSIKDLCGLTIPYAGAEEQKVIVHELDQLIGKQKKAIKAAHCVIKQIDELKKSILAKAFRGELGTNDPADPPVELPQ